MIEFYAIALASTVAALAIVWIVGQIATRAAVRANR